MKERTRLKYELGLVKLIRKLQAMNLEYDTLEESNPMEHIKYRFKSDSSIKYKLNRKNLDYTDKNIENEVKDVIGARIVCPFLTDVSDLIEKLKNDPEIKIVGVKDYITSPKPNGYSSYHIIVKIPIVIDNKIEYVNAELQIRTIIQDMLASLEHKISYKKNINLSETTKNNLDTITSKCNELDKYFDKKYLAKTGKKEESLSTEEDLFEQVEYKKMMLKYKTALDIVRSIINQMDDNYKIEEQFLKGVNPIEHIKYRLKTPDRIIEKVKTQTNDISVSSIENAISDIAGIRIVCSFVSDLYNVINTLKNNYELEVVKEKNYVDNPKSNGYVGYHLIVNIPVPVENKIELVKVEIQVRTIAMDMWAIVERNLRPREMTYYEREKELHDLASIRDEIDENMEYIIKESRELRKEKLLRKLLPNR